MAGYYMAFSLQDINWDEQTIDGFFLDEYGNWFCHTVPFPSVIHNRIPTRALENSEAMKRWKTQVRKERLTMFNWDFFDKWDVYSLLMRDANANRHMPETHLDPDAWLLGEFLKDHSLVYLKPVAGCLGMGADHNFL